MVQAVGKLGSPHVAAISTGGIQKTRIHGDYAVPTTGWAKAVVAVAVDKSPADEQEAGLAGEPGATV